VVYRLFLSHSSPLDEDKQRLRDLAAAIENATQDGEHIKVLYDAEQIRGGDDWRKRIAFMLHVCHGAAVLLNQAAVESDWVLAEATVVSLRHAYDENFVCVPISFLTEPELEMRKRARARQNAALTDTDWSVAKLQDIQFVDTQDVNTLATEIVEVLRRNGALEGDTPVDRLANQLQLPLAGVSNNLLLHLAQAVDDPRYYFSGDAGYRAAAALVKKMLGSIRLMSVRNELNKFGPSYPYDRLETILEALWPLALPAESAELLRTRPSDGGPAHFSICCDDAKTLIPLYLQRAYLSLRPPTHYAIENTHCSLEELKAAVRNGWRTKHPKIRSLTDEQVDERLATSPNDIYVWVPGPIDSDLMQQLDASYPRVAFIIHHSHGDSPSALQPNILAIWPPLTREEENLILTDYEYALAL
jgi:hypothetical protein